MHLHACDFYGWSICIGTLKEERACPYKLLNSTYVAENKLWYTPECTGNGSDGQAGPSPRAFHIAVVIDCNMFIFGGRSGGKRYAVHIAYLAEFGSLA